MLSASKLLFVFEQAIAVANTRRIYRRLFTL